MIHVKNEPVDTDTNSQHENSISKIIIKRSRKSLKPSKNLTELIYERKGLTPPENVKPITILTSSSSVVVDQLQEVDLYKTLDNYDRISFEQKIIQQSLLHIKSKTKNLKASKYYTETPLINDDSTNEVVSDIESDYSEGNEDNDGLQENQLHRIHIGNNSKRPRLSYEKRLEANARERERVHNLTHAFESLRQVIPMYPDQPKLSRLSILRIACSYILTLGALNEIDFSEGQNNYSFSECFYMLSNTIMCELKRKKSTKDNS
ncbi:unnamed protein product [Didymodactylos carnosus]|uniref:BHLH domain-containing protein n=1 Tax=Didymodactylos carnosus TaxID=1234261 RepID=A0A813R083_9BILA|nr:unnamed protein product [Didymodactylos carnosus]CAF3556576.1 unnamed protein product [Didymodactylos carnosus]